jgi:hypothetical protein
MKINQKSFLPLLFIMTAVILSACQAPRQAVLPTSTLDSAKWKIYRDVNHPFSFEYPKSFDDRPLCAIKVKQSDTIPPTFSISMSNSDLKVMVEPLPDPKDTDLQIFVDQLRADLGQLPQVSMEPQKNLTVAGVPALAQRYRTAYSKEGYLEYVFFIKDGLLYTIFLNTPATCDGYPDTPGAVEAFQRILTSFQMQ